MFRREKQAHAAKRMHLLYFTRTNAKIAPKNTEYFLINKNAEQKFDVF